jgi:hypothetical protein
MVERICYWQYSGSRNLLLAKDENKDLFLVEGESQEKLLFEGFLLVRKQEFTPGTL